MESRHPHDTNPPEPLNLEEDLYTLQPAGHGRRLANYLVDLLVFYLLANVVATTIYLTDAELGDRLFAETEGLNLVARLTTLLFYAMFLGIMEMVLRGRTVGKFVTGTIAVNEDGSPVTGQTALLRGLCRAVPFNAFSALGTPPYPWHDKWTRTYVVMKKDLR